MLSILFRCTFLCTLSLFSISGTASNQNETSLSALRLSVQGYADKNAKIDTVVKQGADKSCNVAANHDRYQKDAKGRTVPVILSSAAGGAADPAFGKTLDFVAARIDNHANSFYASFTRGTWRILAGWRLMPRPRGGQCEIETHICTRVEEVENGYRCRTDWKQIEEITAVPDAFRFIRFMRLPNEKDKDDLTLLRGRFRDVDAEGTPKGAFYDQNFLKQ